MKTRALRFYVNALGAVTLATYAAMSLLSYIQAPALWRGREDTPQAIAFFEAFAERFPPIGLDRLFADEVEAVISYFVPLGIVTAAALGLMLLLMRRRDQLDDALVALILRWSWWFAGACILAFPIFTQDFWLSAAWGRMVAAGTNPYHSFFTPDALEGLPLDHFPMMMSYGPAWAIVSGLIMAVSGPYVVVCAILFKALLGAAWVGTVILTERITRARPLLERCLAIVIIGWTPLGVTQTLSEGHNDIAMTVLALLWIYLFARGRWTAPVALSLSVLAKYVTGPLVVVDAIATLRLQRLTWRQFTLRYIAPALLGVAVFAVFFRSPEFFDGTRLVNEWRFLMPKDALAAIEQALGFSLFPAEYAIVAGFAALALYSLVALWQRPSADAMVKSALAIMSAISFALVAHLWPWYLIWTLALAALLPGWWLSRFVIGVSVLAPFTLVVWWVEMPESGKDWAALAMYAGALLWVAATRARSAPEAGASADQVADTPLGRP